MAKMKSEPPVSELVPVPNSLVASAAVMGYDKIENLSRSSSQPWYQTAWNYYHSIGEYRYVCDWIGTGLSKAVLHATKKTRDGIKIETSGPAKEYIDRLFGDRDMQAEMQRLLGIHWTVTGDAYMVAHADTDPFGDGEDQWHIVAPHKLTKPNSPTDYYSISGKQIKIPQNQVACIRLWRQDPEDPEKAISPTQAVLSDLGEIARLTDHIAAQIDSRLAGAGILLLPNEITFPAPPVPDGAKLKQANTAVDLMQLINQAMAQSIRNRSDASAMVPIVITAPGEAIQYVKHLTFWSDLDEKALEMRTQAIRRLALGMDVPPEVLQGTSDSNHWSAWQADESAIKAHIEPLLKIITSSLAKGYLRPLLKSGAAHLNIAPIAQEELRLYSIGADTSELRLRPNRAKEAFELYDRGELNGGALLRETGFAPEEDGMNDESRKLWLLMKIAQGSPTPELVDAALRELGIDLQAEAPGGDTANEARPSPSLEDHPGVDIPDRERSERRRDARGAGNVPSANPETRRAGIPDDRAKLAAAVAVGSEQAIFRALERAGNRMRNKMGGKLSGVSAAETYLTFGAQASDLDFYLDDAWGDNVSALATHAGISKEVLKGALDGYCRILLTTQKPHTFTSLENHLSMSLRGVEAS